MGRKKTRQKGVSIAIGTFSTFWKYAILVCLQVVKKLGDVGFFFSG